MLNDRDEKYEAPEDSEYHFSDDDISYEVEPETAKPAAASPTPKENIFNRLSRSRRMLISLAVFFVLVFVVYKMVAPTGQTTPADINPVIQPVAQQPAIPSTGVASNETAPPNGAITPPPVTPAQTTAELLPPSAPPVVAPAQPAQPAYNPPAPSYAQPAPSATQQIMPAQPPVVAATPPQVAPVQPMQPPVQQVQQPPVQQVQQPMMQQPVMQPPQPMAQQQPMQQLPPQQAMVTPPPQPQVVPVQTIQQPFQQVQQPQNLLPPTENVAAVPTATPTYEHQSTQTSSLSNQVPGGIDAGISQISAQNEKLIAQLQAEYLKRINEYANQNKNLNEQMQQLNSRVASMETEMHKLLQTLTKQLTAPPRPAPVREVPVQVNVPRIAYNVQAIIPGRAWLRSDNGDTVTVAEGDLIKNVGRVVKIDPYDGVVEINTGTRVISLSYGNGG